MRQRYHQLELPTSTPVSGTFFGAALVSLFAAVSVTISDFTVHHLVGRHLSCYSVTEPSNATVDVLSCLLDFLLKHCQLNNNGVSEPLCLSIPFINSIPLCNIGVTRLSVKYYTR